MTYEIYRYIFIVGLILSILMFVVTILIFFLFKKKKAIGDITGSNKRKAIENIYSKSAANGLSQKLSKASKSASNTKTRVETVSSKLNQTAKISAQDRFDNYEATETSVLNEPPIQPKATNVVKAVPKTFVGDKSFNIEVDITYVHSNEIIL